MSTLEDLHPHAAVRGILPECLVTVVSVQWFGSEALELTYKNPTGRVANELLYRHDEARLDVVEQPQHQDPFVGGNTVEVLDDDRIQAVGRPTLVVHQGAVREGEHLAVPFIRACCLPQICEL